MDSIKLHPYLEFYGSMGQVLMGGIDIELTQSRAFFYICRSIIMMDGPAPRLDKNGRACPPSYYCREVVSGIEFRAGGMLLLQ
jgi:hypothetical protein